MSIRLRGVPRRHSRRRERLSLAPVDHSGPQMPGTMRPTRLRPGNAQPVRVGTFKPQRAIEPDPGQPCPDKPALAQAAESSDTTRWPKLAAIATGFLGGAMLAAQAVAFGYADGASAVPREPPPVADARTAKPVAIATSTPARPPRPPGEADAVVVEAEAVAPEASHAGRFQMPLKAWSAVTDRFGAPRGKGIVHGGIDLALDGMRSSPVFAACEGTVEVASYSAVYGWHVTVDCGEGWSTLSGHLSATLVARGQAVTFADVVGLSGSSGQSEGEHLHFELRWMGTAANPEHYLDFNIPAGTPLTRDRRDEHGDLIPDTTPAPEPTATPTPDFGKVPPWLQPAPKPARTSGPPPTPAMPPTRTPTPTSTPAGGVLIDPA